MPVDLQPGILSRRRQPAFICAISLATLNCLATTAEASDGKPPHWIWLGPQAKNGQSLYFRTTFTLAGPVSSARITATCDNHMQVYLNGKPLLAGGDWQKPVYADVADRVQAGRNVIAVWAANDGGPAGLLLRLEWKPPQAPGRSLVTDQRWRVSETARDGWTSADFDDSGWASATDLGPLGQVANWKPVDDAALSAATRGEAGAFATPAGDIETLAGFKTELIYSVPRWQGSWVSLTFDDRGRMITSDQYGRLYRVTPPPIGQAADQTRVEAIDIEIGEAHGLLYAFDSLYVVVSGSRLKSGLYRVRDSDGDDRFDQVELLTLLEGSGEHGPHAIIRAPDGKSLYLVAGNHTKLPPDIAGSRVPRVWAEDLLLERHWDPRGHARGIAPPGGWVCRIDPDARNWELIAVGMRNSYDIAVNPQGELFTYDADMEWDYGLPWYRPTRISHLVSGAELGWRSGSGKWPEYYPDSVPPVVNIGLGSPTGIAFAGGAKFPARYRRALYVLDWTFGKIYAVHMSPRGAGYTAGFEKFVSGKPLPVTDIAIGPDGAMYFTIGGRRMQSGLYRVTYTASGLNDADDESSQPQTAAAEARGLRHQLEALHTKLGQAAVDFAWPHLDSTDRLIRFAARTVLEHQDAALWQSRALSEPRIRARLSALLALVRSADAAAVKSVVLARLINLPWRTLAEEQTLDALRVCGLALIRGGKPNEAEAGEIIATLDPLFPSRSRLVNRELCRLLAYLDAPSVAAKSMKLLEASASQEERIHYAFALRHVDAGWTSELRTRYLGWLTGVLARYEGGASFRQYIENIRNDALSHVPQSELAALEPALRAPPAANSHQIEVPRRFVHNWQMEDLVPQLDQVRRGRSFERGKRAYRDVSCLSCHRFAGAGGNTGHDLTAAAGRLSPRDLLESIIHPSRVISDQYQDVRIVTIDGEVHVGRIERETDDAIELRADPTAEETIHIPKKRIETRGLSITSRMPTDLISILEKDEVLDLLAYVLSGGDPSDSAFVTGTAPSP